MPVLSVWITHQFGNAASTYITNKNQRLRACFLTLDAYGCSVSDTLSAIKSLKQVIMLPFTPQASDTMIEAQVAEILSRLDPASIDKEFLGFLSHHKVDAGDAARIFVDTARRLLEQPPTDSAEQASPCADVRERSQRTSTTPTRSSTTPSKSRRSSDLADVARRNIGGGSTKIFLDSNDLTNLQSLIGHVGESANHLLLLSRATLERPYVLCELAYAFKQKKKIVCILINWPSDSADSSSSKAFSFPQHLDEVISDWEDVAYFQRARAIEKDMEYRPLTHLNELMKDWCSALVGCARGYSSMSDLTRTPLRGALDANKGTPFARLQEPVAVVDHLAVDKRDESELTPTSRASSTIPGSSMHGPGGAITIPLPSSCGDEQAELAAMRRALKRVEASAARGVRMDPQIALHAELEQMNATSKPRVPFASVRGIFSSRSRLGGPAEGLHA